MKLNIVCIFDNSEKTIKDCVESIQNQFYTDFNAILIDNNSSDSSYEIVSNLVLHDKRFKIIRNKVKKFYIHNLIENFKNNKRIKWNDVILQINPDEKFYDNNVFGFINKIFQNEQNWLLLNNKKINDIQYTREFLFENISTIDSLKVFRSFLLSSTKVDQNTVINLEKEKKQKLTYSIPIMEMSGPIHTIFSENIVKQVIEKEENQSLMINLDLISNIPVHEKIKLIRNTIFKSSNYEKEFNPFFNLNIKKKSILPNIQNHQLNNHQDRSKKDPILESKIDLKKIIPPKNLQNLLDKKIHTNETKKQTIKVITNVEVTQNKEQKNVKVVEPNLSINKIFDKKLTTKKIDKTKKEEKPEEKKLNQINYNGLNQILPKKPSIKIQKPNNNSKNQNIRNEIFEIKKRQVQRDTKPLKNPTHETKPKLNIRIR